MALWGKTDAAASAPKFTGLASNGAIANAIFGGAKTGVFGVDAAESQYARATDNKPVAQGWVLQQYGCPLYTSDPSDELTRRTSLWYGLVKHLNTITIHPL